MFGGNDTDGLTLTSHRILQENAYWLALCLTAVLPIRKSLSTWTFKTLEALNAEPLWHVLRLAISIGFLIIASILLVGDAYNPFIYFRF